MGIDRRGFLPWAVLLVILAANAAALSPELSISRVDLNDNVFHFTLVERMAEAIHQGQNPLDNWSPEWTLGYPVLRTYQPLAHLMVVGVWLALFKSVSLMTVFVWVRYLSLLLLPLSFFAAARLFDMRPMTAVFAALLAPLISTNFLYGVEYGSFTWAGSGLFPQCVATHFLLLSLGLGFRAIRRGKGLTLAGGLLGLTFLAHLIYGYIGAISLCLLAVVPDAKVRRGLRIQRTLWVGTGAALLAAFQLAPLLLDSTINHSRWEFGWKWDSFGAGQVLRWLFTGELLDHGRLPVLSLAALGGAGWVLWRWYRPTPVPLAYARGSDRSRDREGAEPTNSTYPRGNSSTEQADPFVLLEAALWIAVFFGRPFWGPLLGLIGVSPDMQLHRVIGGAQIFLIYLAAIGLSAAVRELASRRRFELAAILLAVVLYPAVKERWNNLRQDATWGRNNLANYEKARSSLDAAIAMAKARGGRVYPGLAAGWGGKFKVGDVPMSAFLSTAQIPAVSFLYHSMALTSDIMVRFNEWNPDQYRLFNIQTVLAPAENSPTLPPFVVPIAPPDRFRVLAAPGGGYFDLVDVRAAVATSRNDFYDVSDRWLASPWVHMHQHLLLDWRGDAPVSLPRVRPEDALPLVQPVQPAGMVIREHNSAGVYEADVQAARDCYALFKMTWHANWRAELDGAPVPAAMLSPGFPGVRLPAGQHRIRFQYRPEGWRAWGPILGVVMVLLMAAGERRGLLHIAWESPKLWAARHAEARRRLLIAAGLVLLAAPVFLPLVSSKVLAGHDSFEYFPRLTEFHENISNGILWPRWAPDLTSGNGQPFFLFNPPLIYFAGEFWHLLGFGFVTSMNLACVLVVLASAVAMFLLGQLYFGDLGGWLASAALLYAPYFAVDLFVRSAMAETMAFPFVVLALYGFAAYARNGKRSALLVGAAAYAGTILSHNVAALFFTPMLVAFIVFTAWQSRQWRVGLHQAGALVLGLALAAATWIPSLALRSQIQISRLLEGYLRYSNHFVYLQQFFYSPWGFGVSVAGPNDGMSFALGWSHLLLALAVWILWRRVGTAQTGSGRHWLRFFACCGGIFCFLMLRDAEWLWDRLALLQYLEFPWRLLLPATVCLSLLIAPLGSILDAWARWRIPAFAAAMALLIAPNLTHFAAPHLQDVDPAFWTPSQIAARGIEVTTAREYTPKWVTILPAYNPRTAVVADGAADVQQLGRTPVNWSGLVSAARPSTIQLGISYFPGWHVTIDGRETEAVPAPPAGQIRFSVPAGEHRVEADWRRTGVVWLGDALSVMALMAYIWLAVRLRRRVGSEVNKVNTVSTNA